MRSSLDASITAAAAGIGGPPDHVIAVETDPPLRVVGVGGELAVDHHLHRALDALQGEGVSDLDELRGEVLRMQPTFRNAGGDQVGLSLSGLRKPGYLFGLELSCCRSGESPRRQNGVDGQTLITWSDR
jgi:hypothetical protein